jgi:thiol-disulfide isomerase/thioredoxin
MNRYLLFLAMMLASPLIAQPAEKSYSCEAPADIQNAINSAGLGGAEELLSKYPGNLWVRLAYIDLKSGNPMMRIPMMRSSGGIPAGLVEAPLVERYRQESEQSPGDPEAAYLYAYSLIHQNTAKSVEILTGLTKSAPTFPRPWLSLASIYTYPAFTDQAKASKSAGKFLALCPSTLESRIATLAAQFDRTDTVLAYAKALRAQVAGKENEQTLLLYESLWRLESKLALPSEQAEYRKLLEGDLKFLDGLDKTKYRTAEFLLRQGNQYLKEGTAGNTIDLFAPFMKAQNEWQMANPRPALDASPEARTDYYKKQFQFADQWLEKLPDDSGVISFWFNAASSQPDVSDEFLIQEGNKALTALRQSGMISTSSLDVLRIWAQRGLELDRIPALVQEIANQQRFLPISPLVKKSDLYGEDYMTLMEDNMRWGTDTKVWSILVTTYAKSRQPDKARDILAEWEKALNARRNKAKEMSERLSAQLRNESATERSNLTSIMRVLGSSLISGIPADESSYYEGCAQLAAAEDKTLDALTFYQSSLRMMYERSAALSDLNSLANLKEAEKLWKKLGGAPSAWNAWLNSIKPTPTFRIPISPSWSGKNRTIPQFSLPDQNGKTWTLESFKGKTTLINVWATWCGPCRSERPLVQELYEKSRERSDIQVITLNIDSEKNLVEPFLKKNNFSFPSLFATSFMEKFAGSVSIPMTWIVDSTGAIRNETLGFSSSNTDWVAQTLKRIEEVKSSTK